MTLDLYGVMPRGEQASVPITQLLEKETLLPLITKYGQYLGTTSPAIGASLFIKRYAVATAAASLDYYGFGQKIEDWWSTAHFDTSAFMLLIEEQPARGLDKCWKEEVFANHLTPMIKLIAKECKIPEKILWENVAVRLNAVFREKQNSNSSEAQIVSLYEELTSANCQWLGMETNPFQQYLHMTFIDPENPKRKTCCRYYEVSTPEELPYCYVCPLKHK